MVASPTKNLNESGKRWRAVIGLVAEGCTRFDDCKHHQSTGITAYSRRGLFPLCSVCQYKARFCCVAALLSVRGLRGGQQSQRSQSCLHHMHPQLLTQQYAPAKTPLMHAGGGWSLAAARHRMHAGSARIRRTFSCAGCCMLPPARGGQHADDCGGPRGSSKMKYIIQGRIRTWPYRR